MRNWLLPWSFVLVLSKYQTDEDTWTVAVAVQWTSSKQ